MNENQMSAWNAISPEVRRKAKLEFKLLTLIKRIEKWCRKIESLLIYVD